MTIKNFSSVGGFAVGSTEVVNTQFELKNISAIHMVSDNFSDATNDLYIAKRTTDSANTVLRLSLDGSTNIATNTPALGHNSVAFIKAKIFGQEQSDNTYILAGMDESVVTVDASGVPTLQATYKTIIHEHLPGTETWGFTPVAFQIGAAAYFSYDVETVTNTSTVKWLAMIEITNVTT